MGKTETEIQAEADTLLVPLRAALVRALRDGAAGGHPAFSWMRKPPEHNLLKALSHFNGLCTAGPCEDVDHGICRLAFMLEQTTTKTAPAGEPKGAGI